MTLPTVDAVVTGRRGLAGPSALGLSAVRYEQVMRFARPDPIRRVSAQRNRARDGWMKSRAMVLTCRDPLVMVFRRDYSTAPTICISTARASSRGLVSNLYGLESSRIAFRCALTTWTSSSI